MSSGSWGIGACLRVAGGLALAGIASLAWASAAASGVDISALDRAVRPQDDFYGFADGGWIARTQAPDYLPGWSASRALQLQVYQALDADIERLGSGSRALPPTTRKLVDFHASYMDVARLDRAGLAPVMPYLQRVDAMSGPADIVAVIAELGAMGLEVGLGVWVHADDEQPQRYLADFVQSDLGLPGREYYLGQAPSQREARQAYQAHVQTLLALSGGADAVDRAGAVLALETQLAQAQWSEAAKRVPGATTHRLAWTQLGTAAPGLDLQRYAQGIGIDRRAPAFNLAEPGYFEVFGRLLEQQPVAVWRDYLRYRLLDHLARFLPLAYRAEADRFWTLTFAGASGVRPRWLRAMGVLEDAMGDGLGQLYVQQHFPPQARDRAMRVLDNVVAAFSQRIAACDWMSRSGRQAAQAKLDQLVIRMGMPDRITDYAALRIDAGDAVGNWLRARALGVHAGIARLSRPVDREEWTMSAQSVNGYYSVSRNQVVLPAALLQPPYFQADADDAVNYGALGFFIAHELTHAFDRAGSQYDGQGRRREWMGAADRTQFERRVHGLIAQYARYQVAPGRPLDGELTVGENIADNTGLAIALDAYRVALAGRPAPVLDGFTGEQRFYLGFARIWASEPVSTPAQVEQALLDTHAPDRIRVLASLANQTPFYQAFGVGPGDAMYLPPGQRIRIW